MADDPTKLRKVLLLGPQTSKGPLWRAMLSTSYGPGAKPVTAKSYGLRVLLQTADTAKLKPETSWATGGNGEVDFHVPQLIQLAAGGGKPDDAGQPADWLALGSDRGYRLQPVQAPGPDIGFGLPAVVPLFEPAVAGEAGWPRPPLERRAGQTWGEIAVPPLRLADGRIRLRLSGQSSGTGDNPPRWLDIPKSKAFGCLDIAVSKEHTVTADLVPDGIEFEAGIANPFYDFMPACSERRMWARLRLVSVVGPDSKETLALDLVGPAEQEADLMARLRAGMAAMAASLRQPADPRRMSPLVLRPNLTGAVPALRWLLDGNTLPDGANTVDLPVESVRPAVLTGRITGGALVSTAEIAASRVFVTRKGAEASGTTCLTVSAQPQAGTPAPPASEPEANIAWGPSPSGGTFSFRISAGSESFKLGIDRAGLEQRLTTLYAAANALPAGVKRAPYLFLLTEGGMAQLPLSIGVLPPAFDPAKMPRPSRIPRGAIKGRIHIDMEPPGGRSPVKRQVDIDACAGLEAKATWASNSLTGVTITATAPAGALSGFLWTAEASPSPIEVVPTLRGGPVATRDLPLLLGGDPDPLLQVDCSAINASQGSAINLTLSGPGPQPDDAPDAPGAPATSGNVPAPVTLWSSHPRLPLISAIAMTRSAESATVPSLSRGLVAYGLSGARTYTLPDGTPTNGWRLPLSLDPSAARPAFNFAAAQAAGLLVSSGWPWPAPEPGAAPSTGWPDTPAVPLVLPTLPGVEFTPSYPNGYAGLGLATALRFDLPGLDEYFAAVVPARPAMTGGGDSPGSGATALAPDALRRSWQAAAARLALTRTELARATPWVMPGAGGGPEPQQNIDGLLEPFSWTVRCRFAEAAQIGKAGAGTAGTGTTGGSVLPFGTFSITQTGGGGETIALSGGKALSGLRGWLTIAGPDLTWSENRPPDDKKLQDGVPVAGFGIPARPVGSAWVDTRGIATAAMPWDRAAEPPKITGGGRILLRAAGTAPASLLATLTRPIPMNIDGRPVGLWFANLPFEGDRFDGAKNPMEASPGASQRLFDRDTISRACFEWRLFASEGPERFDLPFGPLRLRPLRLWEVQLASGEKGKTVTRVTILGRVLAAPAGETDGPYGEETKDAGGNVVALTFSGDGLALTGIARHPVGLDPPQASAPSGPAPAVVSFPISPLTDWVSKEDKVRVPMELRVGLGVAGGKLTLANARLQGWLFGAEVALASETVGGADGTLKVTFGDASKAGDLRLSGLTLTWTPAVPESETLAGSARLVVTVPGAPKAPASGAEGEQLEMVQLEMVQLDLGRSLAWLGLKRDAGARAKTVIDHRRGLILCQLVESDPEGDDSLFSGLPLTAPRVTGVIAVALGANPDATPSWVVTAGTVRLRAQAAPGANSGGITLVRHALERGKAGDVWSSRLTLDGKITATSAISWPIYDWSPPASATPTRLDSVELPAEGVPQPFGAVRRTLEHEVTLVLRDHELPAAHLTYVGSAGPAPGYWKLGKAWHVPALVSHTLRQKDQKQQEGGEPKAPVPAPLTWRTLDHVTIDDLPRLVEAAGRPPKDYAFLPRYVDDHAREGAPGTANAHVKHPGIVERPFANAGFPTADMAGLLAGLGPDATRDRLVVSGAGVARVRIGARFPGIDQTPREGGVGVARERIGAPPDPAGADASVLLCLPWLVGVDAHGLPPGLAFTQDGGGTIEVAPMDLAVSYPLAAGGTARRVTIPFPNPRSIAACIRRALDLPRDADLPPLMPADQSIFRATAAAPPDITARPLWLHALQAVARLWPLATSAPGSMDVRAANLVVSGLSDGRSALLTFADPDEQPQVPAPQARVFVLTRDRLSQLELEGTIASEADWGQLPQIARSQAPAPLAVVGGLVEVVDAERSQFETQWEALHLAPSDDFGGVARKLRRREDVLYASPALGWPSRARVAELALLAPGIGAEAVLQDDPEQPQAASGLAGRVRTYSFAARASADGGAADGVFLGFGMRPVFTRPDLTRLPGAAALHLSVAPPRRRVPLAVDLDTELAHMSASGGGNASPAPASPPPGAAAARTQPIVPPQVEVLTVGARPGVLYVHRTDAAMALTGDPRSAPAAFGRPAGAGPAVVSHGRAPRSGAYPRGTDTTTTRRTVVGADDLDAGTLRPFRWLRGPAALLRQHQAGQDPDTVIVRVLEPDLGRITAGWDGQLTVCATLPGKPQETAGTICKALANHLKPEGAPDFTALDARLLVGASAFAFAALPLATPSAAAPGPLSLVLRLQQSDLAAARTALAAASADTPIAITLGDKGPGTQALVPVSRLLRLPLMLATDERATLPVDMATLLFADPAYDRTLSSPTASKLVRSADGGVWLAATDRAGYDLGTPVLFAAGRLRDGLFTSEPQVNKVSFAILRAARESAGAAPRREGLQLAAGAVRGAAEVWYAMNVQTAYRVVLTGFVGADLTPVAFQPGDQLVLAFSHQGKATCEIAVSVLDRAVLPPAEAVYSLVALRRPAKDAAMRAEVPLHACAPLPQDVDHPHLLADLASGIVRRRAIFQWTHPLEAPRPSLQADDTTPDLMAALVKVDRTGGGQIPDAPEDLQPLA
ncbi:hypothetical protein V5F29_05335 [Xanthobacter aminoxidans]|uniref:hypothetical protein n=1 Tax=Xanthobacter aminoxidans TaxID=186280 RepID=UPI0037289803